MSNKSLGVLVTSEAYGVHLGPLASAAKRKKIALSLHFQGEGVRLCLEKSCRAVLAGTHLSICHRSAEMLGLVDHIKTLYPNALTSDGDHSLQIGKCTKHIVL